jgi:hypothetical protein
MLLYQQDAHIDSDREISNIHARTWKWAPASPEGEQSWAFDKVFVCWTLGTSRAIDCTDLTNAPSGTIQ